MKLNITIITILCSLSFHLAIAQENALIGNWQLEKIELKDFSSEDLIFPQEESFFGYYLDPNEMLSVQANKFPVVVGGDYIAYDYEIKGGKLFLSVDNIVMTLKDGKQEQSIQKGSSEFKLKLTNNKLIISKRYETFFESYVFSKFN
tara:strand:- start:24 stop:464 length:441 start_codon:yes stop_codon:yes gene_type:complete